MPSLKLECRCQRRGSNSDSCRSSHRWIAVTTTGSSVVMVTCRSPTWAEPEHLVPRDDDSNTSDVSQTAPDSIAAAADGCAVADDVADLDVPNVVRANGVLLPSTTPTGYCASDHHVGTNPTSALYTVWASCASCERPTSAVARVQYLSDEDFEGDLNFEVVDAGGQPGRLYGVSADVPVARLYVDVGDDESALIVGWNLDQIRFAHLAAVALNRRKGPATSTP